MVSHPVAAAAARRDVTSRPNRVEIPPCQQHDFAVYKPAAMHPAARIARSPKVPAVLETLYNRAYRAAHSKERARPRRRKPIGASRMRDTRWATGYGSSRSAGGGGYRVWPCCHGLCVVTLPASCLTLSGRPTYHHPLYAVRFCTAWRRCDSTRRDMALPGLTDLRITRRATLAHAHGP